MAREIANIALSDKSDVQIKSKGKKERDFPKNGKPRFVMSLFVGKSYRTQRFCVFTGKGSMQKLREEKLTKGKFVKRSSFLERKGGSKGRELYSLSV